MLDGRSRLSSVGAHPGTWAVIVGTGAVAVCQGFARFTYGILLPRMTADVIGSIGLAGTLGTLTLAAYLVGVLLVSLLSTRLQPAPLVIGGLVGTAIGMLVVAVAGGVAPLALGMIIMGFASAGVWVPTTALVSSMVAPHRRGTALGLVVAGPGISIVIAGQLDQWLVVGGGPTAWRRLWLAEFAIAVVVLTVAVPVLRNLPPVAATGARLGLSTLRRLPRWWAAMAAYASFGLGYMTYMTYAVAALQSDAGFSPGLASMVYTVVGGASIFGGMVLGRVSDRFGRRRTLVVTFACLTASAATIILGLPLPAFGGALVFGLGMAGTGTLVAALVGDHLDGGAVGSAFGMLTVVFGVTQMLAPHVGGLLAAATGSFTTTFALAVAALTAAAGFALYLPSTPPETRVRARR